MKITVRICESGEQAVYEIPLSDESKHNYATNVYNTLCKILMDNEIKFVGNVCRGGYEVPESVQFIYDLNLDWQAVLDEGWRLVGLKDEYDGQRDLYETRFDKQTGQMCEEWHVFGDVYIEMKPLEDN